MFSAGRIRQQWIEHHDYAMSILLEDSNLEEQFIAEKEKLRVKARTDCNEARFWNNRSFVIPSYFPTRLKPPFPTAASEPRLPRIQQTPQRPPVPPPPPYPRPPTSHYIPPSQIIHSQNMPIPPPPPPPPEPDVSRSVNNETPKRSDKGSNSTQSRSESSRKKEDDSRRRSPRRTSDKDKERDRSRSEKSRHDGSYSSSSKYSKDSSRSRYRDGDSDRDRRRRSSSGDRENSRRRRSAERHSRPGSRPSSRGAGEKRKHSDEESRKRRDESASKKKRYDESPNVKRNEETGSRDVKRNRNDEKESDFHDTKKVDNDEKDLEFRDISDPSEEDSQQSSALDSSSKKDSTFTSGVTSPEAPNSNSNLPNLPDVAAFYSIILLKDRDKEVKVNLSLIPSLGIDNFLKFLIPSDFYRPLNVFPSYAPEKKSDSAISVSEEKREQWLLTLKQYYLLKFAHGECALLVAGRADVDFLDPRVYPSEIVRQIIRNKSSVENYKKNYTKNRKFVPKCYKTKIVVVNGFLNMLSKCTDSINKLYELENTELTYIRDQTRLKNGHEYNLEHHKQLIHWIENYNNMNIAYQAVYYKHHDNVAANTRLKDILENRVA